MANVAYPRDDITAAQARAEEARELAALDARDADAAAAYEAEHPTPEPEAG